MTLKFIMSSKKTNQEDFDQNESQQEKFLLREVNKVLTDRLSQKNRKETAEINQENLFLKQINEFLIDKKQYSAEEIFAILNHELRTPLVPILGYLDILLEEHFGILNDKQKSRLEIIKNNTESLMSLISNIIDYQKIKVNEIVMKKTNSDISEIAQRVISDLDKKIKQKNTSIQLPKKSFFIDCDPKRIEQVFLLLINNSLKVINNKKGEIKIEISEKKEKIIISISDNGVIFSEAQLTNIFSELYQTDLSSTRERDGFGIELQLCFQIIDKHGGTIWAENNSFGGTTIKISLPK
jgi:signal transduction histidine kinase